MYRGFKTNAFPRSDIYIPPGVADIIIVLSRGNLIRAYSVVTTISICEHGLQNHCPKTRQLIILLGLITLILLLVMITSVFFGFRQRGEVLLIPVATLFAFTQLRQSMPGAPPGFGMLTFVLHLSPSRFLKNYSGDIAGELLIYQ